MGCETFDASWFIPQRYEVLAMNGYRIITAFLRILQTSKDLS